MIDITPHVGYCALFRDMRLVYDRKKDQKLIKKESPGLWCLGMGHQTKTNISEYGRLFVTDNFYTRHTLDNKLLNQMTYGEKMMLGTIRMNIVDSVNRIALQNVEVFSNGRKADHGS